MPADAWLFRKAANVAMEGSKLKCNFTELFLIQ